MERLPKHFEDDPMLRVDYCDQQSLDEYEREVFALMGLETNDLKGLSTILFETDRTTSAVEFINSLQPEWLKTINPRTNINEVYYLQGWVDKHERRQMLEQSRVRLLSAAIQRGWFGNTLSTN